jgi:hypothetical protein
MSHDILAHLALARLSRDEWLALVAAAGIDARTQASRYGSVQAHVAYVRRKLSRAAGFGTKTRLLHEMVRLIALHEDTTGLVPGNPQAPAHLLAAVRALLRAGALADRSAGPADARLPAGEVVDKARQVPT